MGVARMPNLQHFLRPALLVGTASVAVCVLTAFARADEPGEKSGLKKSESTPCPTSSSSDLDNPHFELPVIQNDVPLGRNEAVDNYLRNALANPDQAKETGDVVLDGIMEAIRRNGSTVAQRVAELTVDGYPKTGTARLAAEDDAKNLPEEVRTVEGRISLWDPFVVPAANTPAKYSQDKNQGTLRQTDQNSSESDRSVPTRQHPNRPSPNQLTPSSPGFPPHPHAQGGHRPPASFPNGEVHDEQKFLLAEQLLMTARLLSADRDQGSRRQLIQLLREEAARCLNSHPSGPGQSPPYRQNYNVPGGGPVVPGSLFVPEAAAEQTRF